MSMKLDEKVEAQLLEYLKGVDGSENIEGVFASEILPVVSTYIRSVQVNMKDGRKHYFKVTFEVTRTPNKEGYYDSTERILKMEPFTEGVKAKTKGRSSGTKTSQKPKKKEPELLSDISNLINF